MSGLPGPSLLSDREEFRKKVAEAIDACHVSGLQMAVVLVDIHRLFEICSSLPERESGDFLQELMRRVDKACTCDHLAGRIRLDELVLLLTKTTREEVREVSESLVLAFAEPVTYGAGEMRLTASIGVSLLPRSNATVTHVMRRADAALGMARRSSGDRLFIYDTAAEEAEERQAALERELRRVLVTGGLFVEFQPVVHMPSYRMIGAEALLRWRTEDGSLVSPGAFIPLAEHSGMMSSIGAWMFRESCQQWSRMRGSHDVRLAINVTASQLEDLQYLQMVESVIAETGVEPEMLEIEITETTLLREDPGSMQRLHSLREMGMRIVIDDFGTGYSSIGYLRKFPVDRLKIDRSFVMNIPESQKDCSLTRAVLALSEHLGIPVVAEGVEREEQRRFLMRHGCEEAQGYLFSPPVRLNDLEDFALGKRLPIRD